MAVGTRRDVVLASLLTFAVPAGVAVAAMSLVALLAARQDGWGGLGIVLVGMAGAAVLAVVALVVTAPLAFRRMPSGQRWRPSLAAVAGTLVATVPLVVGAVPGGTPTRLCLLTLPVLLPLVVTGHARWRWVAIVGIAAVVLGFVDTRTQQWGRTEDRRAELARFDDALPLTDGRTLDSPLPGGWAYLTTRWPYGGSDLDLTVQWRRGAGTPDEDNYTVDVSTDPTDCAPLGTEPTCTVVGRGVHGDVTLRDNGTRYLFVTVDDVEWRVDTVHLDQADAVTVLDSLEAVDVDTFVRVAEDADLLS